MTIQNERKKKKIAATAVASAAVSLFVSFIHQSNKCLSMSSEVIIDSSTKSTKDKPQEKRTLHQNAFVAANLQFTMVWREKKR